MEWVKLTTDYYRDVAIAVGTDAAEVMFTRGCALAGEIERHGFLPDALIPTLTRKPGQAKRIAAELVQAELWEKVRGGYQIANWETIQAELERIVERKKRDRDRKRADRAAARGSSPVSEDASADSPSDSHKDRLSGESKSKRTTAAARAGTGPIDLPSAVEILKAKLDARKLTVRWDRLTADEIDEVAQLIATHGDGPLVHSALHSFRADAPPVFASAWLAQWRSLRAPGDLAVVKPDPCDQAGHTGTTSHCKECASERLAEGTR